MSCVSRREGSTASKAITPPHRLNRYTDPFQVELGWLTWKSERGKGGNDLQKKNKKKFPIWQNTILKGMSVMFNSRTKVNSFWSCHKLERWNSSCKIPAKTGNPSTSAATQRFQWSVCTFYERIDFDWSVWVIYMQKVEFFLSDNKLLMKGLLFMYFILRRNQIILWNNQKRLRCSVYHSIQLSAQKLFLLIRAQFQFITLPHIQTFWGKKYFWDRTVPCKTFEKY